jgi:N-acetylglucosaminyldiphosphoundecaprenol N-acetyl-beta-D-mannosaminyltransferase
MVVWVGLSTPKQEQLTVRLAARLPRTPIVAIGAGFDFVAGLKPVAPAIVTSLSLEWLFRLLSEPRRLFWRYAEIVPRFLFLVGREAARGSLLSRSEAT